MLTIALQEQNCNKPAILDRSAGAEFQTAIKPQSAGL